MVWGLGVLGFRGIKDCRVRELGVFGRTMVVDASYLFFKGSNIDVRKTLVPLKEGYMQEQSIPKDPHEPRIGPTMCLG